MPSEEINREYRRRGRGRADAGDRGGGVVSEHDTTELAIANVVANIDGVSDRVIDGLDAEFGTATAVANASRSELEAVDGIGPVLGRRIASRTSSALRNPEIHVIDDIYTRPQCSRQH